MSIAQQIGHVSRQIELSEKARQFVNLARCIAMGRGDHGRVQAVAHDHRILMGPTIKSILDTHHAVYALAPDVAFRQKAVAAAGGSDVGSWAEPLGAYQVLAN